jgi:antirestriction protein ArdC
LECDISLQTTHICIVDADGKVFREGVASSEVAPIGQWLRVLKEDKRAIFRAAAYAQRAVDFLHGLQPQTPGQDIRQGGRQ